MSLDYLVVPKISKCTKNERMRHIRGSRITLEEISVVKAIIIYIKYSTRLRIHINVTEQMENKNLK